MSDHEMDVDEQVMTEAIKDKGKGKEESFKDDTLPWYHHFILLRHACY
jgi:hypothetical protein